MMKMAIKKITTKKYLAVDYNDSAYLYDNPPTRNGDSYSCNKGDYSSGDEILNILKRNGIDFDTDSGIKEVVVSYEIDLSDAQVTLSSEDYSLTERVEALEEQIKVFY